MIEVERKIGPKGQVVIPKNMRESMKLHPGSKVVFEYTDHKLQIEPVQENPVDTFREVAEDIGGEPEDFDADKAHEKHLQERLED